MPKVIKYRQGEQEVKYTITQNRTEPIICLGDEITYGHRPEWSDATWRPLKLSLMRSRQWFDYDPQENMPVIIWLCGGAFTHVDKNVWAPEMSYFAKNGFAVASIEYSTTARTRFPMPLEDIKLGIRYLKAHARQLHLDPDRMVVMGESAGGYLAALTAVTGDCREYNIGEYPEQSSAVRAAIPLYPCVREVHMEGDRIIMPDITKFIDAKTPPFLIIHGTCDHVVSCKESEYLYESLITSQVPADLCLIEGAEHADSPIYQTAVKDKIIQFIRSAIL